MGKTCILLVLSSYLLSFISISICILEAFKGVNIVNLLGGKAFCKSGHRSLVLR